MLWNSASTSRTSALSRSHSGSATACGPLFSLELCSSFHEGGIIHGSEMNCSHHVSALPAAGCPDWSSAAKSNELHPCFGSCRFWFKQALSKPTVKMSSLTKQHLQSVQVGADLLGNGPQQLRLPSAEQRLQRISYAQLRKQPPQRAHVGRVCRIDLHSVANPSSAMSNKLIAQSALLATRADMMHVQPFAGKTETDLDRDRVPLAYLLQLHQRVVEQHANNIARARPDAA